MSETTRIYVSNIVKFPHVEGVIHNDPWLQQSMSYSVIDQNTNPETFIESFFLKHGGGHKPNNITEFYGKVLNGNPYENPVMYIPWTPKSRSFGVGMPLMNVEIETIDKLKQATGRTNVQVLVGAHCHKIEKRWYARPSHIVLFGKAKELLYVKTACNLAMRPAKFQPINPPVCDVVLKDSEGNYKIVESEERFKEVVARTTYEEFFD